VAKKISETMDTTEQAKFFLIAGNLSVDFVNTKIVENGAPKDLLADFRDLAVWAAAANLLKKTDAEKLAADWSGRDEIEVAFAEALKFRKILHAMIANLAHGKTVNVSTINAINRQIKNQSGSIEVRKSENGFEKLFRADLREPRHLIAPIAESAADLLCYGNTLYLKKCESDECVLYFYDTTKNHSRLWCSMAGCGNRAKAAAFYRRAKSKLGNR
jgi:predicted RNA-binding Zn ribbon-like protein